jgi:threonine/homoserine/homoserine lactone efflux protein
MEALAAFVIACFALAGSPGPATLSMAAGAAAFGPRNVIGYVAGLLIGIWVVMAATGGGLTGLVIALPGAAPVITVFAGAYFIWLAWRIATAPPLSGNEADSARPTLFAGFLLSLVNPKGYAAMAALFSGFVLVAGSPALDFAAKMLAATGTIICCSAAWLAAGSMLSRLFHNPRASRILNVTFAVLLLASVGLALLF